ncbi:MAG: hypothetical protein ACRDRV_14105 [Pseudonocardiaceae bacterium]
MGEPVTAGGYAGRVLVCDVTGGPGVTGVTSRFHPLADRVLRAYLGGAGLGAWLLHQLAPPRVDPQ